ncbi:MAG: hypothetical protein ACXWHF_08575 [Chthoniobacterales bacterium]
MLQNLYPHIAQFHGLFVWVTLATAIAAIGVAFAGWSGRKPVTANLLLFGIIFVIAMDLEFISGLLLYFGADATVRPAFIGHGVVMFFAVASAHLGGALSRKGSTDMMKYRAAAVAYTISLLLMLAGIPWHPLR